MAKERPCRLCPSKRYGNVSWCRVHWFARKKAKQEATKAKRLARKLASKKHQQSELKKWKAKAWKAMSEWVRRSGANFQGYAECFTCRKMFPWKDLHCGHYIHGKLDLDPRNLRRQCPADNTYHGGRLDVYTLRLIEEHGMEWLVKLRHDAATHPGYSLEDCKRIHAELSAKLSTLQ